MSQASQLIAEQYRNGELVKRSFGEAFYIVSAYGIFPDGRDVTNDLQALVNLANSQGRSAIFFPSGDYVVTYINNDENIYYFGDNAKFVGGYSRDIAQIGQENELSNVVVDITKYGAVGDGTTDNTAVIQNLINTSVPGTVIYVPAGSFKVKELLIQNTFSLTIDGSGELKGSADTAGITIYGVIHIENSTYITVKNIGLSGVGSGLDDRGVYLNESTNVTVRDCRITNFSQQGIWAWGNSSTSEATNHIYDNYFMANGHALRLAPNAEYYHIMRNKFIRNGFGIYGAFGNDRVDNNLFIFNDYGIYLDSSLSSNPDHSSISGNVINHNKSVGLLMSDIVNGMAIVDNQILSNVDGGFWPTTGKPHSLVLLNVKDLQFIGNRVDADSTTGSTIYVNGHQNCRYIGNTFSGGEFKEEIAGGINTYMGNRYIAPSKLTLHASTPVPIRMGDIEQGVLKTDFSPMITPTTLTKVNGWVDDAAYFPLMAYKDIEGIVHIQGTCKSGTAGSIITTLPTAMRPTKGIDIQGSNDAGAIAAFRLYTNGQIQQLSGGNTLVTINASFRP